MAYRDQEAALRVRVEALVASRTKLDAALLETTDALTASKARAAKSADRLATAGPKSGPSGWRQDRVDVAVWVLATVGLLASLIHIEWHHYISRDPTVIPAILWLGAPGLLTMAVAWPYAGTGRRFQLAFAVGLLVAILPVVNLALGGVR